MTKRNDFVLAPLEDGNQKYAIRSNADVVVLAGATGSGKAQPLDEPILTVNGWKQMRDIRIGDELPSPLNREPSIVTGVYPQGAKPIYKITTSDGRTTRCCEEHLWRIHTHKQVTKYRNGCRDSFFVKTTQEIKEEFLDKGKDVFIPVMLPYLGKEKELPIDPYILGVWIGDGCRGSMSLEISNDESDIIERIAEKLNAAYTLHASYSYTNRIHKNENVKSVISAIDTIGLNVYSRERFIPEEYLHASIEQRMELLKGLMDSDGNVEEKNRFSFSTTSTKLKDSFVELCRSLGYVVGVRADRRERIKSGVAWDVSIQTNDIIFSSKKHLSKYRANLEKYKNKNREYKHDFVRIVSIEYIGKMEAQCIMVSNRDHLYITNDYIVTHNTVALYYAPIEYLASNDNAKIVCFMRNISDFFGAGKVGDTLKSMYPLIDRAVKKQPQDPLGEIIRGTIDMGMRLYNGSETKFQQLDNENPIVIDKIAKGLQAKKLIFDECNKFEWRTITSFFPRLRSDSTGKAQVYLAQNPERECFLRKLCGKGEHGGGWINDDGTVDKDMDGVVMYFNMQEGDVDKTYFGRTKLEVYEKCKEHIDALLVNDPDMTYEDYILSMVFYTFDVRDNKALLAKNKKYRGLAANSATALSAHSGNWNYSLLDEEVNDDAIANSQLQPSDVDAMFRPAEIPRGSSLLKRFMTVDYASTGMDNLVMKYWELWSSYGYICRDIRYSLKNDNRTGVTMIAAFRDAHGLSERDMILDVQGSTFLRDCFPNAIFFAGASAATNRAKAQFKMLKDEAAHIAMEMVIGGLIHYEPRLAQMHYAHNKAKRDTTLTILRQMRNESVIFQWDKTPNGRLTLLSKEKQHLVLKGMSPDLFDNVILLCGGTYHTCYNMLRDDAGVVRKRIHAQEMMQALGVTYGTDSADKNPYVPKPRKPITNSQQILNILSTI